MIVIKREFQDLDPNDAGLGYRYDRDAAAAKELDEWIDLKADMVANGQRSPILVDKIYDEDFVLLHTYVTDGFKRWIAAKANELDWATINAVVTTWVAQRNAIQIQHTTVNGIDPVAVQLRPEFAHTYKPVDPEDLESESVVDGDSAELAAHKAPADFPSKAVWEVGSPEGDYEAAKAEYDENFQLVWADTDAYIETNGQPENMIVARRDMKLDSNGHVYFTSMIVSSREDSLAVVSCKERSVTIGAVSVRTLDRTGQRPAV